MDDDNLDQNFFNYGSIFPIILFIMGMLEIYYFASKSYGEGFLTMIGAFIVYILTYFIGKNNDIQLSKFNRLLENHGVFMAFGLSSIVFGVVFYSDLNSYIVLLVVYFFALASLLSTARNWILEKSHSNGWPLPFNGLFLPFVYYVYAFYLQAMGGSIFLFYFVIVGVLATTNYNFTNFQKRISTENDSDGDEDQ